MPEDRWTGAATACKPTACRHLTQTRPCFAVPPELARLRAHSPVKGTEPAMMKTLFLQPPSFDGFDGGAGSRYQARREIKSFWFPTWLAQPAALVPGSK